MKTAFALIAILIGVVLISGCTQTPSGGGPDGPQAGGLVGGEIPARQAQEQAFQTVDQEMEQAVGSMTLEDVENELLQQG